MSGWSGPDDRSSEALADRCVSRPVVLAVACAILWLLSAAQAWSEERSVPAAVASGRHLLSENGCNGACHQARTGSADPATFYGRATRRVNSREELRQQVDVCVSRLNAMIFPEDIEAIVSALDHDDYHFE